MRTNVSSRFWQWMCSGPTSSTDGTSISRTSSVRRLKLMTSSGLSGVTSIVVAGAAPDRIFWMRAMIGS